QLGGAVGLAVIVSVYAAAAVPGEFVPGVREGFLASAAMAFLATGVTLVLGRTPRAAGVPVPVAD
ncbi:MAG TPA: MFS transporter, partial [Nocardioides sp.]|nr:MFS transporter [Nocardioides sp.]